MVYVPIFVFNPPKSILNIPNSIELKNIMTPGVNIIISKINITVRGKYYRIRINTNHFKKYDDMFFSIRIPLAASE